MFSEVEVSDPLSSRLQKAAPAASVEALEQIVFASTASSQEFRITVYRSVDPELLQELLSTFPALSSGERLAVLESLIHYEAIPPAELLKISETLNEHEKGHLGYFLGKCTSAITHIETFQKCFPFINYLNPEEVGESRNTYLTGKLIDKFTIEQPEKSLLVAPFTDLSRFYIKSDGVEVRRNMNSKARPSRGKKEDEAKPLFSTYFNSFDRSKLLLKTVIRNEEARAVPSRITAIVDLYIQNRQRAVVIPYLPELVKNNLITIEKAREVLGENQVYAGAFSTDNHFLSIEERQKIDFLTEKTKALFPEKFRDSFFDHYQMPERFQEIVEGLYALAERRAAEHMLSNFAELRDLFSSGAEAERFVVSLLDFGHPVFSILPANTFTVPEIQRLLNHAENEGSDLSLHHCVDELSALHAAGHGRWVQKKVMQTVSEYGSTAMSKALVEGLDRVAELLGPQKTALLCRQIDEQSPALWLANLDAMSRYSRLSLKDVAVTLATHDELPAYYAEIANQRRLQEQKGLPVFSKEELQQITSEMVGRNPELLFHNPFYSQAFPAESRPEKINELLENSNDVTFIARCVNQFYDEDNKEYRTVVRENLIKAVYRNEDLIAADIINHEWRSFSELLPRKERIAFFERQLDALDPEEAFESWRGDIIADLIAEPGALQSFLSTFFENGKQIRYLGKIGRNIAMVESNLDGPAEYKKRIYPGLTEEKLKSAGALLQKMLLNACLDTPRLLLDDDVQDTLGVTANKSPDPFARKLAAEFLRQNGSSAEEYLSGSRRGTETSTLTTALATAIIEENAAALVNRFPPRLVELKGILSESTYDSLLRYNYYGLLLSVNRDGGALIQPFECPDLAEQRNFTGWLEDAEKKALEKKIDLHQAVMETLSASNYYSLFEQSLSKFAEREVHEHGVREEISDYDRNREFFDLARRPVALEFFSGDPSFAERLSTFDAPVRETIISQIQYLVLYVPEMLPNADWMIDEPEHELRRVLGHEISSHMKLLFDVTSDLKKIDIDKLPDAEMLRALITYYSTVCVDNEDMEEPFKNYILHVSRGNFSDWRSWGTETAPESEAEKEACLSRLKEQKLVPGAVTLEQYEKWLRDLNGEVESDISEDDTQLTLEMHRILSRAAPNHIPLEVMEGSLTGAIEAYSRLTEPLHELTRRRNELRTTLKSGTGKEIERQEWAEEFQQVKTQIQNFLGENKELLEKAEAKIYLERLKQGPGRLYRGRMQVRNNWVSVEEVFSTLKITYGREYPEFNTDLTNLEKLFNRLEKIQSGKNEIARSTLLLSDSVDLKTHFFIGEKPVSSCQHYDSRGSFNKGLLSYSVDPAVRIVQIYDEKERIIARAVLRLLETEEGEPALLLERMYSVNNHPQVYRNVQTFAARKAAEMGLTLYGQPSELSYAAFDYGNIRNLRSSGSRSGHVYTDAGGGLQRHGIFMARHCIRIDSLDSETRL